MDKRKQGKNNNSNSNTGIHVTISMDKNNTHHGSNNSTTPLRVENDERNRKIPIVLELITGILTITMAGIIAMLANVTETGSTTQAIYLTGLFIGVLMYVKK